MRAFERHPHFIIAGAMKAGTSTLHAILAAHPEIFIPPREMAFFDIDDFDEHPDFRMWYKDEWHFVDFNAQIDRLAVWYSQQFSLARPFQIIGEDATGYLSARKVPHRLRMMLPTVKIIVLLRDPADRTYSHYWHMVKTGRECHSFEDSLILNPESKLRRSLYKEHIERYLRLFPREQLFIASFEEFVKKPEQIVCEILEFLGVDPSGIPVNLYATRANPAKRARFHRLRLFENLLCRKETSRIYVRETGPSLTPPIMATPIPRQPFWFRGLKTCLRRLNPQISEGIPPLKASTRKMLDDYFRETNSGLSELCGRPLDSEWYKSGCH